MFEDQIKKFIDELARQPLTLHMKNPWDYSRAENEIRRKNLFSYFTEIRKRTPAVMLIGEAPGYRGCGRVGVPFSSEKLVLSHPFFANRDIFAIENIESPVAEASASIVWKAFDALEFYPLMWATYPYHPHKPGNPASNRPPTLKETEMGKEYITKLINIYAIQKIVAVGRVAEKTLRAMGIHAFPVRHPSHGGATLFTQGLGKFKKGLAHA